jgi:DNA segregation ATPase FtsK/SpoIIIE-like protein
LSGSSARDITIPFSVSGTATGTGADYTVLTPSPLILEAGETSTGVILQFIDDASVEDGETIILTLGSPTNAAAGGTGSITITLTSDDVAAAASSSSQATVGNTGGGGGGFRGSPAQMAARIAQARVTILARFEGTKRESERLANEQKEADEPAKKLLAREQEEDREEQAAKQQEDRMAERIAVRKAELARIEQVKKEYETKYALHREERYARALALEEQRLAENQAALLKEQEELAQEQEANRQRREERQQEQERRDYERLLAEQEEVRREEQAAKEREARIAQRIQEHETQIAQSQQEQEELRKKYALHREERFARALEEEQKRAAEAETALLAEQEALQAEQEANALRRREQLAEHEAREQEALKTAAPTLFTDPKILAARRGRLFALVGDAQVVFKDVSLDEWYAPYVSYVIEEGIATGYEDEAGKPKGEFGVSNPITYAEVLKMAMQASDQAFDLRSLPPPRNASAKGTWASAYVAKAEALSLSVFAPSRDVNKPATRAAVIQTILEVLGFPIPKTPATFADVPTSHPYSQAIGLAAYSGFISGDTGEDGQPLNRFRPDDPINRAEVAKIIALVKEVSK